MEIAIGELARLIAAKRGSRGVRTAAAEVGISSATFSRIENGHMPDLATFAKVCQWLERDPNEFLGVNAPDLASKQPEPAQVHLRKKKTASKDTAESLGALIIAVQEAARAHNKLLS
jgi:transcriptional regulator with XRE-family HTH domain